jgi:hypothetical protein
MHIRILHSVVMHQMLPYETKSAPARLCQRQRCAIRQSLPLRILARHELIQNPHNLLQALQPRIQLLTHSRLIITQLGIEVLPIGCRTHGGAEDGLHDEAMVLFECIAVCISERIG